MRTAAPGCCCSHVPGLLPRLRIFPFEVGELDVQRLVAAPDLTIGGNSTSFLGQEDRRLRLPMASVLTLCGPAACQAGCRYDSRPALEWNYLQGFPRARACRTSLVTLLSQDYFPQCSQCSAFVRFELIFDAPYVADHELFKGADSNPGLGRRGSGVSCSRDTAVVQ